MGLTLIVQSEAAMEVIREIAGDDAEVLERLPNGELDVQCAFQDKLSCRDDLPLLAMVASCTLQNRASCNEGLALLQRMATSPRVFVFDIAPTVETAAGIRPVDRGVYNGLFTYVNLDVNPDWRFRNGKQSKDLPPAGVDSIVVIDPSLRLEGGSSREDPTPVTLAAVAFHELAEAYAKVELGLQYKQRPEPGARADQPAGPGAHAYAIERELILLEQRPDFSPFPAGETELRIVP